MSFIATFAKISRLIMLTTPQPPTMTAILGRMATNSGQEIKYADALEKGTLNYAEILCVGC
jgi:hypothetical protein